MILIDAAIDAFYSQSSEDARLTMGLGPLEFERNKELISRYLPGHKCFIADVGGGVGHYAQWLAGLGHQVILIDPVTKHIKQAERRSKQGKPFKNIQGEARRLPLDDHSVDVVIMHGPLYHLQDEADRIAAIKEARRVLKMNGMVLAFAITRPATTLAALQNGMIHQPDVLAMCRQELQSGEHDPPELFPGMLTTAYFHRPAELIYEFETAGFEPIDMLAVEGMAWIDGQYFQSWASPEKRERLLELIRLTEKDRDLLCLSPHMMLAAGLNWGS